MGKSVKNLRSGNCKCCSKTFRDYLKAKGITDQTKAPHGPGQNGIAER